MLGRPPVFLCFSPCQTKNLLGNLRIRLNQWLLWVSPFPLWDIPLSLLLQCLDQEVDPAALVQYLPVEGDGLVHGGVDEAVEFGLLFFQLSFDISDALQRYLQESNLYVRSKLFYATNKNIMSHIIYIICRIILSVKLSWYDIHEVRL